MVFNISSIIPSLLSVFSHFRETAVRQLAAKGHVLFRLQEELGFTTARSTGAEFGTVYFLLMVGIIKIQFLPYLYT